MIDRIPYQTTLPDSFFDLAPPGATGPTDYDPGVVRAVFALESARNEIIVYTDHRHIRLVGIFPTDATEAYFGFWKTTDDLALNQRAFALLEADARQRGRPTLAGPLNFSTFHRYRLRLDEPSWNRFDREPTNPPYYPALLDRLEFGVRSRFESRRLLPAAIPLIYEAKKPLLTRLPDIPFEFVPLTPDVWQQTEDELFALVHDVFGANPAYKPISREQFGLLYNRRFAEGLCPRISVLLRDRASGRLAGLSFCQPNYQSLHLPPHDPPRYTRDFARLTHKVLLIKSVGVHPAFRQRELMSYLGAYGMLSFRELYADVIFCLMRTDNFSRHFTDGLPAETAHYALYEKSVQPTEPACASVSK